MKNDILKTKKAGPSIVGYLLLLLQILRFLSGRKNEGMLHWQPCPLLSDVPVLLPGKGKNRSDKVSLYIYAVEIRAAGHK